MLHPGSPVILDGIKEMLGQEDDHFRLINEVYRTKGDTGSVLVLEVLSQMLSTGPWRDHIILAVCGPGTSVEMFMLKTGPISDSNSDEGTSPVVITGWLKCTFSLFATSLKRFCQKPLNPLRS